MNKVIIVEASDSDCRLMSGLLTRAGYEPISVGEMEAAKHEVMKLSPGAVNIFQRPAIFRQLVEMVNRYASSEDIMFVLDHTLLCINPRISSRIVFTIFEYLLDSSSEQPIG